MTALEELAKSSGLSTYREMVFEQIFASELLQAAWLAGYKSLELDRPFVDYQGYDLVISHGAVTRHVQLKATKGPIGVHEGLTRKRSGCVVNMKPTVSGATPRLRFTYEFWGEPPGEQCRIDGLKRAKKTMNSRQPDGTFDKSERLQHWVVPTSKFEKPLNIDGLLFRLFGEPAGA